MHPNIGGQRISAWAHHDIGILEDRYIEEGCIRGWRILEPWRSTHQNISICEHRYIGYRSIRTS